MGSCAGWRHIGTVLGIRAPDLLDPGGLHRRLEPLLIGLDKVPIIDIMSTY